MPTDRPTPDPGLPASSLADSPDPAAECDDCPHGHEGVCVECGGVPAVARFGRHLFRLRHCSEACALANPGEPDDLDALRERLLGSPADPAAPALDPRGEAQDGAGVAVGGYQPDPDLPAAPGWCEAIIAARPADKEPGGRLCFTKARYLRDGQRVCGLHARSHARGTRRDAATPARTRC